MQPRRSDASARVARACGPKAGFTLIEVLAAVLLTAIVIATAFSVQLQIGDATSRARGRIRVQRHAIAILDRIARDLEGAYLLVKPEETDPLDHPWLFIGTQILSSDGADAIKFVSRNHRTHQLDGQTSDLAVMSYFLVETPDEPGYQLMRWLSPRLPETLDANFPSPDDESSLLIAEDLAFLHFRFIAEDGSEAAEWDSTQLEQSGMLPLAVKIEIGMLDPDTGRPFGVSADAEEEFEPLDGDDEGATGPGRTFTRIVRLPMRPVDFAALVENADQAAQLFAAFFPEGAADLGASGDDPFDESDGDEDDDDESGPCGAAGTILQCAAQLGMQALLQENLGLLSSQGISASTCVDDPAVVAIAGFSPELQGILSQCR